MLGKKLGMTRVFSPQGEAVSVTVIEAGPCVVVQRKTADRDGYEAIQIGYEERSRARTNQPETGHFERHGVTPKKHLKEWRLEAGEDFQERQELTVGMFNEGQIVDIIGTSKGRGFAGAMKRYGFKGGPAQHGSKVHRSPMSGGATDAARVFPGKRGPGHMGAAQATQRGLNVVRVDPERNLILVRGSVPGPNGGLIAVRPSKKTVKGKG
ncbi:MAG TPA: 50S ribosomal protein L3 [Phycisphaerae bacterium]|nr:50S ribosomal protein L3 [Phycisphaerae bacterium]